jgi:hypothetical protein
LTGHAADANHRFLESIDHDEAHLQQDLELVHDIFRRALVKRFRTITALQYERIAALRLRDLLLEVIDFPGGRDWRQATQIGNALSGYDACCEAGNRCQLAGCHSFFGTVLVTLISFLSFGMPGLTKPESADYATAGGAPQKFLMQSTV